MTPIEQARAALNRRTSSAAWSAFLAQLPVPVETRLEIDLQGPAAGSDLDFGPRRPLAAAYAEIAASGTYPTDRYPSPSEARGAVVLHALCYGWTPAEVQAEVRAGRWPGLARLYKAHYERYAGKALAGDLTRAQAHLTELRLHRIHTSAARPRAGGANAARLHLQRWTAALNLAIHAGRWETQRSYSIELILLALGDAGRRSKTIYPAFGVRHLSMGTGTVVEPSSVAKTLKVLASEDDPFVLLIEAERGVEADVYELRIPDAYLEQLPADDELPPAPIGVHPAFSLLPRTAYRLYTTLETAAEPLTRAQLAEAAAMPLRTVYATVNELQKAGLIRQRAGRAWTLSRRSLTRFARLNRIATHLHDTVLRWRQERISLRIAHGLDPVRCPEHFTVAWPGMSRPTPSRPPSRARPSDEEILHAADPPRPNWRADAGLEEATAIELLQHRLGAILLTEPERRSWAG
ncbi:MAG: helix-turn-helix domain-containing protein [Jatrophihabitantaceae bacterium]